MKTSFLHFAFMVLVILAGLGTTDAQDAFFYLDLSRNANMGFYDEIAGDGKGGWADFGSKACLSAMPAGVQIFQDGLIPFNIIDPGKNDGKSVVVLSGPKRENDFPGISGKIMVGRKLESLFFLHTTMYAGEGDLVRYRIHYADNSELIFDCAKSNEIDDWWDSDEFMTKAVRCYNEDDKWLINTAWKNPDPGNTIRWIRMESTGNAIPLLVAVTASTKAKSYDDFIRLAENRIVNYRNSWVKVAFLQLKSTDNIQENLKKGEDFCRRAKEMGADIALFPEMYSIGYNSIDFEQENAIAKWKERSFSVESEFVKHFRNLARELDMAIVFTYLEDIGKDRLPRNTATLIDRHGNIAMNYSKVHTLDFFNFENAMTPGDDFYVADLDTRAGIVKTGIMICYDREFPESARILMLKGAEVILTPNACGLDDLRLNQFRTRAFENAVVTAMTNYAGSGADPGYNGHSCMYSADGSEILVAGEDEGVYMASFNIHDERKYRSETIWGNAYRRPHKYLIITSPEVNDPWQRKNSFGEKFESEKR